MINYLERAPHLCGDDSVRSLFAQLYTTTFPYDSITNRDVDLNQTAEVGMAFTLLYHNSSSRYYHSALA